MEIKNLNIQGLYPKDELNLYLVLNGLKPATLLDLDPCYIDGKANIKRNDSDGILEVFAEKIDLTKDEIQTFRRALLSHNFVYNKYKDHTIPIAPNALGTRTEVQGESYFIARDKPALERLVKSWQMNDDFEPNNYERGLALGYPELASKHFKHSFDGNFIDGGYWIDSLKNGIRANAEIPTWLGYLSHIPVNMDVVNKFYSKESEEQGKLYESFVRMTNPLLALKVDGKFKREVNAFRKSVEKE